MEYSSEDTKKVCATLLLLVMSAAEDMPRTSGFFSSQKTPELEELEEKFPKLSLLLLEESIELELEELSLVSLEDEEIDVELDELDEYNSLEDEEDESIELELEEELVE